MKLLMHIDKYDGCCWSFDVYEKEENGAMLINCFDKDAGKVYTLDTEKLTKYINTTMRSISTAINAMIDYARLYA